MYKIESAYNELREIPTADCEFIIFRMIGVLFTIDNVMIAIPKIFVMSCEKQSPPRYGNSARQAVAPPPQIHSASG